MLQSCYSDAAVLTFTKTFLTDFSLPTVVYVTSLLECTPNPAIKYPWCIASAKQMYP